MVKPGTWVSYSQKLFNKEKPGNLVTESVFGNSRFYNRRNCTEHDENEEYMSKL
jgi:hypothetical protein